MSCMGTEPVVSMYIDIISPAKMATNMCLIKVCIIISFVLPNMYILNTLPPCFFISNLERQQIIVSEMVQKIADGYIRKRRTN
jgi:hypothetical protein